MPSNLNIDLDDITIIEARLTADEILDILDITLAEFLQSLPATSIDDLKDYLELWAIIL